MRLQAVLGYFAAALMIPVALATFLANPFFSHKLVDATGIKISPWFSGGDVIKTIEHGSYQTSQHKAIFDGLLTPQPEGFVQIDWSPLNALPDTITEDIDYDLDGTADFHIEYNTKANTAVLTPYTNRVVSLEGTYQLKERRAVRIHLLNK